MAEKEDPVVEIVEEEERGMARGRCTECGAEAEKYQDKINQRFRSLYPFLIHQDTKTALSDTIQNFKKIITKQWDSMGTADTDVVLENHQGSDGVYTLRQHLMAGGIEVVDPPLRKYHLAQEFLSQVTRDGPGGQKRWLLL